MRSLPINLPAHRAEPACDFARAAFRALLVEVNLTPSRGWWIAITPAPTATWISGTSIEAPAPSACGCRALSNAGAKTPLCRQSSSWRGCGRSAWPAKTRCFALPAALTHKGSVFSLGLLCTAFGRLQQQGRAIAPKRCAPRWRRCAGAGGSRAAAQQRRADRRPAAVRRTRAERRARRGGGRFPAGH